MKRRGGDNHNGRKTQATGEANVNVDIRMLPQNKRQQHFRNK